MRPLRFRTTVCRVACMLLAPAASAFAQRDTSRAVVRDSLREADRARASQPPADTRRLLPVVTVVRERPRAAPPPVPFIDAAASVLQRSQSSSAYDLVRRTTGIEVHEQGQGPGFTANAVLRGFNSDHSADVLLVVDGVPVNAAVHGHVEGFADWNLLVPAATQSLRVIHGSASPLYGDFALAGVVEAFTAADAQGQRASLSSSSFGDLAGWWQAGQRRDTRGWVLTLDGLRGKGWQPNAGSLLGNAVLRGWQAVGGGRLEGGVQLYSSAWDSPGFVSIARYNTRDLRRAVDSTDGGDARRLMAHLRYARSLGRLAGRPLSGEVTAWHQQARSDWFLTVPGEGAVVRQARELDDRTATGGQAQALLSLPKGQLMTGVAVRRDDTDYLRDATLARVSTLRDHAYDAEYASLGAFVRWQHLVGSRLGLDLGLRTDRLQYTITDRLRPTGPRDKETLVTSPKLGARYRLPFTMRGSDLTLLGSVSQGFRGAVGVIADPSRAPFMSWSYESGVLAQSEHGQLHLSFFETRVRNERVFDATTLGVSSAGHSRRRGLDVRGDRSLHGLLRHVAGDAFAAWRVRGAFTLNDARFLTTASDTGRIAAVPQNTIHDHNIPILPGDPVPGVARYTGHLSAEAPLPRQMGRGAMLRTTYRVLGPFTPIGEPGLTTRAASVLDLGASFALGRLAPGIAVDVDMQNAFDLRYVENRASGFITPGLPRVLRVAFRLGALAAVGGDAH
ncbi:TonB-dependent receptor [Gemmatimonas sp.]